MSKPPTASRPSAPEVAPVEYQGVRYEQDRHGDRASGDQPGGYLVAVDAETGARLWRLKVYEVPDHSAAGVPNMGRYFRSMRLVPDRPELEIENESGGRYLVNVETRTVKDVSPIPASAPPRPPAGPKPKP